jgi:hypothetical protein
MLRRWLRKMVKPIPSSRTDFWFDEVRGYRQFNEVVT